MTRHLQQIFNNYTRVAVDENVGIYVRFILTTTGRFHRLRFVVCDVVAAVRMLTGKSMTLLIAKSGRQSDGDANDDNRDGDSTDDAQHRTQIPGLHYD